ncbi:hypothetical protein RhiirB3_469168 [Rhizophagus irregularis]|nr:hypothetical protein RhiirB3_469168 [Rhizophagus irregularis]
MEMITVLPFYWIWGPIFPNGEELLKEILTRIKSHQFHAICLTVWICKSNPFTVKKKCFTISIFLISKILERIITRFDGFDKRLNSMILQQVPQPVPQPTNTAKQVKNHLGRKSQGIQSTSNYVNLPTKTKSPFLRTKLRAERTSDINSGRVKKTEPFKFKAKPLTKVVKFNLHIDARIEKRKIYDEQRNLRERARRKDTKKKRRPRYNGF